MLVFSQKCQNHIKAGPKVRSTIQKDIKYTWSEPYEEISWFTRRNSFLKANWCFSRPIGKCCRYCCCLRAITSWQIQYCVVEFWPMINLHIVKVWCWPFTSTWKLLLFCKSANYKNMFQIYVHWKTWFWQVYKFWNEHLYQQ